MYRARSGPRQILLPEASTNCYEKLIEFKQTERSVSIKIVSLDKKNINKWLLKPIYGFFCIRSICFALRFGKPRAEKRFVEGRKYWAYCCVWGGIGLGWRIFCFQPQTGYRFLFAGRILALMSEPADCFE